MGLHILLTGEQAETAAQEGSVSMKRQRASPIRAVPSECILRQEQRMQAQPQTANLYSYRAARLQNPWGQCG